MPKKIKLKTSYTGQRLNTYFKTEDQTRSEHRHGVIYHVEHSEKSCREDYIVEAGTCIFESIKDHGGRDTKLHILKHYMDKEHTKGVNAK